MRELTKKELKEELEIEIENLKAELAALRTIEINLEHKKLTNKAILSLCDAKLRDNTYRVSDQRQKELVYSFSINENGHSRFSWQTIDAMKFTGETIGFLKQSEIVSPGELKERIESRIEYLNESRANCENDLARIDEIVNRHNELIALIDLFNNSISYGSLIARIK